MYQGLKKKGTYWRILCGFNKSHYIFQAEMWFYVTVHLWKPNFAIQCYVYPNN